MRESVPLDLTLLEKLGVDIERLLRQPFKPHCMYIKALDWFFYLSRDCSYVEATTEDPHVELLKHGKMVVGMKILWFSELPRQVRSRFIEIAHVDIDSIVGIEDIWLLNFEEMRPEIEAAQTAFFEELRRRENHFQFEALHTEGSQPTRVRNRHARIMRHFALLDPDRLPS
jgi:hypothetical protein